MFGAGTEYFSVQPRYTPSCRIWFKILIFTRNWIWGCITFPDLGCLTPWWNNWDTFVFMSPLCRCACGDKQPWIGLKTGLKLSWAHNSYIYYFLKPLHSIFFQVDQNTQSWFKLKMIHCLWTNLAFETIVNDSFSFLLSVNSFLV